MDVDMVLFTGSTEVGRYFLMYSAQSNMKEIVLECGGKSPQVIFDDANLDELVDDVLAAAFWNMGENCSCGSRLIVQAGIKDALLARLKARLAQWKVGQIGRAHVGPPVTNAHHVCRLLLEKINKKNLREDVMDTNNTKR